MLESNHMAESVPFNPAQHGGVNESWRAHSRSGTMFFIFGILFIVGALLFWFFGWARATGDVHVGVQVGFWLCLALGIILFVVGVWNLMTAQAFNSRVRLLKREGYVTRGSIVSVRHTYRLFGATWGTGNGDLGGRDSGWFFKVRYAFTDHTGRQRKAYGVIPDPLGPKRRNTPQQQTFIDPGMPRVGHNVDVLFNVDESVILRIVAAR